MYLMRVEYMSLLDHELFQDATLASICYSVDFQHGDHDSTLLWEKQPPPPRKKKKSMKREWYIVFVVSFYDFYVNTSKGCIINWVIYQCIVDCQYWDRTKSHIHCNRKVHDWTRSFFPHYWQHHKTEWIQKDFPCLSGLYLISSQA